MNPVVKIKRTHPDAAIPKQANSADAAYDLVAVEKPTISKDGLFLEYRTGLHLEPPPGYHFVIHPRSSICKYDLALANSIGLVDNGYRGEILCRFKTTLRFSKDITVAPKIYQAGDAIAQLMIEKDIHMDFEEVENLGDSERGTGGFGSSGQKGGHA